jgi:hypothetical protein
LSFRSIDFASFYDYSVGFCNCSDSVVYLLPSRTFIIVSFDLYFRLFHAVDWVPTLLAAAGGKQGSISITFDKSE